MSEYNHNPEEQKKTSEKYVVFCTTAPLGVLTEGEKHILSLQIYKEEIVRETEKIVLEKVEKIIEDIHPYTPVDKGVMIPDFSHNENSFIQIKELKQKLRGGK